MPKRLSSILGVDSKKLEKLGVFNAFVEVDSKLHVDPSLLSNSKIQEFKGAQKELREYFNNVIKIIAVSSKPNDVFWKQALKKLTFKENNSVTLGYSFNSASGSGIGKELASNILSTAKQIITAGIKDPEIFELIGLLEDNIGADRISDMIISILAKRLKNYTERVCKKLKIKTKKFGTFNLPINPKTKNAIIFVPKELLNDLPVAYSWDEIDYVCKYNEALRGTLNSIIGNSWKEVFKDKKKHEIREILLGQPEVLKDLIKQYQEKERQSYNFDIDKAGEVKWAEYSEQAINFPLDLKRFKKSKLNCQELLEVVLLICEQFKKLTESNGWNSFLYLNGRIRNEKFPQKLFYGIADVYCEANDLDISQEPNSGSGALDFKFSDGKTKVSVELKYSKNGKLIDGYQFQLPAYINAEKACAGIYLIIQVSDNEKKIEAIKKMKKIGSPELIIIDGRIKPSASKRTK